MRLILFVLLILNCVTSLKADNDKQVIEIDGKKYTIHQVNRKETLFSIAKLYNIELDALITVNRLTVDEPIGKNNLLIIPIDEQKIDKAAIVAKINNSEYQIHLVQPGETIYSIAKMYKLNTEVVMESNGKTTTELKYGEEIIIPLMNKKKKVEPKLSEINTGVLVKTKTDTLNLEEINNDTISQTELVDNHLSKLKQKFESTDSSKVVDWKRGIATWVDDGSTNSTKFYALYNEAPVGSVLQIKNMLNFKTVYVKVVGKMPQNYDTDNSIIKLSAAVTDYLGIYDERFLVEVYAHQIATR